MRRVRFAKLSGAGNDFVVVERSDAARPGLPLPELARRLCRRRASVGADGLLVLSPGRGRSLPRADYYNADGSAAFCANATRCAAWRMRQLGWAGRRFELRTCRGLVAVEVAAPGLVRVRMPAARRVRLNIELLAAGRRLRCHFVDTGVPHVVIETAGLARYPVVEVGRAVRRHRAFAPAGANVDFVSVGRGHGGPPLVRIRTYERGVEDETLACGTGAAAAAVCLHLLRGLASPARLLTAGGDELAVDFRPDAGNPGAFGVRLEGPARTTFEGAAFL